MPNPFNALSVDETRAVTDFVRAEYDRLVLQQQGSYLSRNAESDPEGWQASLRQLIAADPLRVRAIVEAAQRRKKGFTLIELSMVLVIIGLSVGGVMVGHPT